MIVTIGEKIKEARERKGLTQEQLGKMCGTTKQTIFKYENGIIKNIPLDKLEKIAESLSVNPIIIMGWKTEDSPLPSNILPMPNMVKKPRLGTIACGKPILAVEDAEEFDMVPETVDCDFTLRCKGDSMINAHQNTKIRTFYCSQCLRSYSENREPLKSGSLFLCPSKKAEAAPSWCGLRLSAISVPRPGHT